jgi:hypothetical protein
VARISPLLAGLVWDFTTGEASSIASLFMSKLLRIEIFAHRICISFSARAACTIDRVTME